MDALLKGIVAGYGIAIPVGAIAVLIVGVGIKSGFRCAAGAGTGAATADLIYSAVAVIAGTAVAGSIESIGNPFRIVSGTVLVLIGVWGLYRGLWVGNGTESVDADDAGCAANFFKFLGLTLINPLTVVYFSAFVLGSGLAEDLSNLGAVLFVVGAFAASLSWQLGLAAVGAVARRRLSDRIRAGAVILGNLIIIALAIVVLA